MSPPVFTTLPASSFNPLTTLFNSVQFGCDFHPFPIHFQFSLTQFLFNPLPVIGRRAGSQGWRHGGASHPEGGPGVAGRGWRLREPVPTAGHRP